MTWKTMWLTIVMGVLAMVFVPYFLSSMIPPQLLSADLLADNDTLLIPTPFEKPRPPQKETDYKNFGEVFTGPDAERTFLDADLQTGWIPWIIKQVSILIGGLSLIIFVYAGINLVVRGDNEEELGKSTKMVICAIVGIALAAFSYTIIANLLNVF